jgi:seryl-tRNA synthetase
MHDIKAIRENPKDFDAAMARRGLPAQAADLLKLDEKLRAAIAEKQEAETARNAASKMIGAAKAKGDDAEFERLRSEVGALKDKIEEAGNEETRIGTMLRDRLLSLPNIMADDVPMGADESANQELRQWGTPTDLGFAAKDHTALGEALGMLDFEAAAKISGARFAFLKGDLARLERALGAFMLDVQTQEHGFLEVAPPLLVRDNALIGTNQLPKFADDQFRTTTDHWLIPTAEVPLTNLAREAIHDEAELPHRYCAYTPCFRSEAGSAGKDTRGLIRMHQFMKVEMVVITTPENSDDEHERMTNCAEEILKRLELPYRVMLLCSGDTGFGAQKTHDLEVWLPSQNTYREISSVSNCGDFQARRMNARCRPAGEKKARFVHTLNGSGIAVGRALLAMMENYQREDGSIEIPAVLRPYMGGQEVIDR